jgi:hypothetical protein
VVEPAQQVGECAMDARRVNRRNLSMIESKDFFDA